MEDPEQEAATPGPVELAREEPKEQQQQQVMDKVELKTISTGEETHRG